MTDHELQVLNKAIQQVTTYPTLAHPHYYELVEAIDNLRLVWAQIYSNKDDNDSYKDTH